MRVLVTGGAGFLGSAIVREYVSRGDEVVVVDDMSTGSVDNVADGVSLLVTAGVDIVTPGNIGLFDTVFHFASPASPDVFLSGWDHIVTANVYGLSAASRCVAPGGQLIVASSSEAYGQPVVGDMVEDNLGSVRTQSVRGVYDESKRLMEAMTWSICHQRDDISGLVLRIFNTYGPGMPNDGRVINTFVRQALAGEPLTVHGDGSQMRSFAYVDDTVGQIMLLVDLQHVALGRCDVVNVGGDVQYTVSEVAQIVQRMTGATVNRVPSTRPDDPLWRRPNLGYLRCLIGDMKLTSLEEGIQRCLL